jgi:glycerol-3-phosphate acyltransferase PlsX
MEVKIALDAMGGDNAPTAEVIGAVEAFKKYGVQTLLVGQEEKLKQQLVRLKADNLLPILNAEEVITMEDSAMAPIRKKKRSSLRIAAEAVKSGDANALVSAGNTGAVMATAKLVIGGLEEVERPALAIWMSRMNSASLLLDVGANSDCKPIHLQHFAVMGSIYASSVLSIKEPRVAILSIGTEEEKGNDLTKEAFRLLSTSGLNFVGNAEGHDLFKDVADVIVTDGFTGNVVLKAGESIYEFMNDTLKKEFRSSLRTKLGYLLSKPVFDKIKQKLDYAEFGGAFLLGVKAVTIICHGKSKPKAIMNALKFAASLVQSKTNDKIGEKIKEVMGQTKNG